MKLIFVRHGDDVNDNLTSLGRRQAKMICHELEYEEIDCVYVSPKKRTMQTANIICKRLDLNDVIIDTRLSEREKISPNMSKKEQDEFNENYLNPNFSRVNPEGCMEYKNRIFEFLDDIRVKDKDKTVLVVGHSSMIYILLAYIYGVGEDGNIKWARLGNCSKLCFENI